jgi:hypothetical protein
VNAALASALKRVSERRRKQIPSSLSGGTLGGSAAAQPAVAVGRTRRSLRSLVRPPLNGRIVMRTEIGIACMYTHAYT